MRVGSRLRLIVPLVLFAAFLAPALPAGAGTPGPVTISLQSAPADPTPADEITVSGTVIFGQGEPVATPIELTVSRHRRDAVVPPIALPSVTTEADGTFEFTDLPGAGAWRYEVTYPGDAEHQRWTATINVNVRRFAVEVSAQLAPGQTVRWGQRARYVGRVTALEGPEISRPMTMNVIARGTCGWSGEQLRFPAAADGTFAFLARPACPRDTTLSVASMSDADHAHGAATVTSSVSKGSAEVVVGFDLPAGSSVADWLAPTGVGAGVRWWATGRGLLDVYAQPHGKPKVRVHRAWLNFGEGAGFTYHADRRTVFTAVYHGDEGLLPGSKTSVLSVRPHLRQRLDSSYKRVEGWRVFHRGTNPKVYATLSPAHAGKSLHVFLQRRVNGVWREISHRIVRQDRAGAIRTMYKGRHVAGTRFRVRTSWAGDVDHVVTSTGWRYFRFTK